ncbi:peptide/nickel transport system permease protein [Nocardiopsis arvandica]|uniref:Peptide/nickel transport system permease protein n=1 Tax=Nocardiopsis sinuspersici TaxID=501010 RepID=A0A7Z0BJ13_9ACTN|nr:ABC transporter permease [Nocardiopsis sinuspersici]NYH51600.1 peptide/nickel transport system permease protein [Nocardiopsis sinuspersici]
MPTTPSSQNRSESGEGTKAPEPAESRDGHTPLLGRRAAKVDRLAELMGRREEGGHGAGVWRTAFDRMRRSPMAITGAVIVAVFVVVALFSPVIAPYEPVAQTWGDEVFPNRSVFVGPRAENWLGLDNLGRDQFSRMVIGARQTLLVGVVATLVGFGVGALLGGAAGAAAVLGGRWGRQVDNLVMRVIDMMLALPTLLLAVTVAALVGPSLTTVMIAVGVAQVPIFARLLRGAMLSQGSRDYVLAARALGVRKHRIALVHILPNSLGPVIVQSTLTLATAIIDAAALSYLGLGNPDPAFPEWGTMLADAQRFLSSAPQLAVYPALAIIVTALGFTLLGEAMREALDPKLRK